MELLNVQGWAEKYKELINSYKTFASDIVQIKQDLQFYLALVPVGFVAASFFFFYYYKVNLEKIAKLQGQKAALQRQLVFLMNLQEKHILNSKEDFQLLVKQNQELKEVIRNIQESKKQQNTIKDSIQDKLTKMIFK